MKTMLTLLTLVALLGASFVMGQRSPTPPPGVVRPGSEPNNEPPAINFVRLCESGSSQQYALCIYEIAGLYAGIDASEDTKDNRSICFPKGQPLQPNELVKNFSKYVAANPKKLDKHIGHVAYQAFLEAYPCKK